MTRRLWPLLLAALLAAPALAEEGAAAQDEGTDYQRYDLVRDQDELTVEGAFNYWQEDSGDGYALRTLNFRASLEYAFATKHTVAATMPYTLALSSNPEARPAVLYAPGDLSLSYEYLKRFKHVNLFFGPQASVPLSENTEYATREGVLATGAGRFTAGFTVTATGVMDPVVWNLGLRYDVGLPKRERFTTSWLPGTMQLSASVSDLVNERFGFSVDMTQQLDLPVIRNGVPDKGGVSIASLFRLEVFVLFEQDYVRVAMDTYAYPLNRPVVFGIVYGHQFKWGDKPRS
jgi:hypothetical protein